MGEIKKSNRGQCADKKNHVKPSVIKRKLKISQNLSDNGTVLGGHVHTHK